MGTYEGHRRDVSGLWKMSKRCHRSTSTRAGPPKAHNAGVYGPAGVWCTAALHTGKHPGHHTPGFTNTPPARVAPHPGLHEKHLSPTWGFHIEARGGTYPHPPALLHRTHEIYAASVALSEMCYVSYISGEMGMPIGLPFMLQVDNFPRKTAANLLNSTFNAANPINVTN